MHLTLPAVASLLLLLTAAVEAAASDRWFRVELLVFSQQSSQANESWNPTPLLAYPQRARFLIEPDRVSDNQAKQKKQGVLDPYGRQIFALAPARPGVPDEPNEASVANAPSLPTPFRVLPASQREFRGKAAYMQRTGRYTTLFHQAWLQPVADSARAVPLILDRSGDTGEWPGLQGSVNLYLSRYLHLETNMWLNTTGDYLPGEWQMPAPPLGPQSVIIEQPPAPQTTPPVTEQLPGTDSGQPGDAAIELDSGPVYPYRHAVLLQQKRRMRSNEVHYIDHPLIGLVVKLTPVENEDLVVLAEAEQTGDYPPLQP